MPGWRQSPAHAGRLETGAFPILPTAARFLPGAPIAEGTHEPSAATPTTQRSGGVGGHPSKTKRRRRKSGATRPHTPQRPEPALERRRSGRVCGRVWHGVTAGAADGRNRHGEGSGWRPARCGEERAAEEGRNAQRPPHDPPAREGATRTWWPPARDQTCPHPPAREGATRTGALFWIPRKPHSGTHQHEA